MSISSPANLSSPESSASITSHVAGVENSLRTEGLGGVCSVSASHTSNGSSPVSVRCRPWEGPLPKPRVLPKLSIGEAMGKAKIIRSPSSTTTVSATRRGSSAVRSVSDQRFNADGQDEFLGAGSTSQNSNQIWVTHGPCQVRRLPRVDMRYWVAFTLVAHTSQYLSW
jgi:hypothetical protein